MNKTKTYIYELSQFLDQRDFRMSGKELADHLNRNGFKPQRGGIYYGERGTYALIAHTFAEVESLYGLQEANKIARVFVNIKGKPPFYATPALIKSREHYDPFQK